MAYPGISFKFGHNPSFTSFKFGHPLINTTCLTRRVAPSRERPRSRHLSISPPARIQHLAVDDSSSKTIPMTIDSHAIVRPPSHHPSSGDVFKFLHGLLCNAFREWDVRVEDKDARRMRAEDFHLRVPDYGIREVLWGVNPQSKRSWSGIVGLRSQRQSVIKLKWEYDETVFYGTAFGIIEDFDCYGATIYFGSDSKLYYNPRQFGDDESDDDQEWPVLRVKGGYDMCLMSENADLDPRQYDNVEIMDIS